MAQLVWSFIMTFIVMGFVSCQEPKTKTFRQPRQGSGVSPKDDDGLRKAPAKKTKKKKENEDDEEPSLQAAPNGWDGLSLRADGRFDVIPVE